jgi:protoporphyrinogen/coproporphyrinogen III oxidase
VRRGPVVVIGAGLSGLSAACALRRRQPGLDVMVLEASDRPGGNVRTTVRDGYTIEHGPGGFLANAPATLEMVTALGLDQEIVPASEPARNRYLWHGGRLVAVPTTPVAFLRSPLLSLGSRLRVLVEPFVPARTAGDESVHAFAARRLGSGFAQTLVGAMVRGVTAGDAHATSLPALFPAMRRMEAGHGSLTRALLARRGARRDPERGGPGGPGGRLTTFRGGMRRLIDELVAAVGGAVRTSAPAVALEHRDGRYVLELASGERVRAAAVILATPAHAAARVLEATLPAAAEGLAAIPYAGVRVVALGYLRRAVAHPLQGFGYLVPPGGASRLLGVLWTSSVFPQQAPEDRVLLRVLAGGVGDPAMMELGDDEALGVVCAELRDSLGIESQPELVQHVVWPLGIPQYELGHLARLEAIEAAVARMPGLALASNAYRGVGVNDCVAAGERAAGTVIAALEGA